MTVRCCTRSAPRSPALSSQAGGRGASARQISVTLTTRLAAWSASEWTRHPRASSTRYECSTSSTRYKSGSSLGSSGQLAQATSSTSSTSSTIHRSGRLPWQLLEQAPGRAEAACGYILLPLHKSSGQQSLCPEQITCSHPCPPAPFLLRPLLLPLFLYGG